MRVIYWLLAAILALAAGPAARATTPAPKPGPLAEPKSVDQVGFPAQLYKWVIPAHNPSLASG